VPGDHSRQTPADPVFRLCICAQRLAFRSFIHSVSVFRREHPDSFTCSGQNAYVINGTAARSLAGRDWCHVARLHCVYLLRRISHSDSCCVWPVRSLRPESVWSGTAPGARLLVCEWRALGLDTRVSSRAGTALSGPSRVLRLFRCLAPCGTDTGVIDHWFR